jgi:acetolactate synthase-1/2/3 large subunit
VIVPADVAWSDGGAIAPVPSPPLPSIPATEAIEHAAAMLRSGSPTAILLSGNALYGRGLAIAGRIAAATGAKLLAPYPITRIERGVGTAVIERIPYVREQAIQLLQNFRQLILVGAPLPVAYFAHPAKSSLLMPAECKTHTLAKPGEDYVGALDALASCCSAAGSELLTEKRARSSIPSGELSLGGLANAVAALLPENAIVVDESMTSGRGLMAAARGANPHDWLTCTGGSIGIAMPLAMGAAVACPDRRVLCLSADGSGMYTLQALWTMARENLKVTTVILANRLYSVLKREYLDIGVGEPGPRASALFDLGCPDLDWVSLAKGMGVPGARVASLDDFAGSLRQGFASEGPALIEVPL